MKDYMKPTFTLAGLFPVAFAAGACNISESVKNRLEKLYGIDWKTAFVDDADGCSDHFPEFEMYCKYTSEGIPDAIKVLGS